MLKLGFVLALGLVLDLGWTFRLGLEVKLVLKGVGLAPNCAKLFSEVGSLSSHSIQPRQLSTALQPNLPRPSPLPHLPPNRMVEWPPKSAGVELGILWPAEMWQQRDPLMCSTRENPVCLLSHRWPPPAQHFDSFPVQLLVPQIPPLPSSPQLFHWLQSHLKYPIYVYFIVTSCKILGLSEGFFANSSFAFQLCWCEWKCQSN